MFVRVFTVMVVLALHVESLDSIRGFTGSRGLSTEKITGERKAGLKLIQGDLLDTEKKLKIPGETTRASESCGNKYTELEKVNQDITEENDQLRNIVRLFNYTQSVNGYTVLPRDCWDLKQHWGALEDGVYFVYSREGGGAEVMCDMTTDGGGWTVFQRRLDGKEDFTRNWKEYKSGFGNLKEDFWWGNQKLHDFTKGMSIRLRVDLENWEEKTAFAEYTDFSIGSENEDYVLNVGNYTGTAGDAFNYPNAKFRQNNRKFSTFDRDNDSWKRNCAAQHQGGFWFSSCYVTNLNGKYYSQSAWRESIAPDSIAYVPWKDSPFNIKFTEMKYRPMCPF